MNINENIYPQRTYDLNVGNINRINIENEYNFEDSGLEESQNGEKMLNIFNDINKNIDEAEENINKTNKILNMYKMKIMENDRKLKQNYRQYSKTDERFNPQNNNLFSYGNKFKYSTPSRIYRPNIDFSNKIQNNYLFDEMKKINNYNYHGENNKTDEFLNKNDKNKIKKGFIKRTKSATVSMHNKSNHKDDISISSNTFYENQKKINFSNKEMEKLIQDINAFKSESQYLLKDNKILNEKINNYEMQIKEKDLRIHELEEKLKNKEDSKEISKKEIDNNKASDKIINNERMKNDDDSKNDNDNNNNNNEENNSISRDYKNMFNLPEFKGNNIFAYRRALDFFQNEYDKQFNINIKLKKNNETLKNELKERENERGQYKQLLEDIKNSTAENYKLKSQIIELNNDNKILFERNKQLEEENELLQKEDKERKIKSEEISIENIQKEKKIEELTEKIKKYKMEKNNLNINLENAEREMNNMKKEFESLKSKAIKCERLENQNENLKIAQKQKEIEIKDLNNIIKNNLKEHNFIYEYNDDEEEEEKSNRSISEIKKELDNKNIIIENLILEKNRLEVMWKKASAKLTNKEAEVETKKAAIEKYHKNIKEIQNLKKKKEDLIKTKKEGKKEINKLKNRIKELENIKFPKKKKK